jgi:hypothetical protein
VSRLLLLAVAVATLTVASCKDRKSAESGPTSGVLPGGGDAVVPVPPGDGSPPPSTVLASVQLGEWANVGNVRLKLDRAVVQKPIRVRLSDSLKEYESEGGDAELIIWLSFENRSKAKLLRYHRWSGTQAQDRAAPELTDSKGNKYRCTTTADTAGHIKGGHKATTATIRPGDPALVDAVTFERPVDAAGDLRLKAPLPMGDRPVGLVEFRIPAAAWAP